MGGPHLVLAYVGRYDSVVGKRREQRVEYVGRAQAFAISAIARKRTTEIGYFVRPAIETWYRCAFERAVQSGERRLKVALQLDVDANGLPEFAGVDIGVNDLRVRSEAIRRPRDAVVETHAERKHEVGSRHRQICGFPSVHPEHSKKERVAGRSAAEAVDRSSVRQSNAPTEFAV